MNAKEAHALFIKNRPGLKAVSCTEYRTLFVFRSLPENHESSEPLKGALDDMTSVNKSTGEVRDFKPFHIPIAEYKSGKKVGDYK